MSDEPKISKHHTGQHPALKSFRAFDIIPPSKVKPGHTARPIITSQPKHFDNTLMPASPEPPAQPQPVPTNDLPAENPKPSEAEPVTAHADAQPTTVPQETSDQTSTDGDNVTPDEASEPTTTSEEKADTTSSSEATTDEQAIGQDDLDSILNQPDKPEAKSADASAASHSPAFASALQEFASSTSTPSAEIAKPVVVVHQHEYMRVILFWVLWLVACVAIAAIILDILLDTNALQTSYNIPHTHFFN